MEIPVNPAYEFQAPTVKTQYANPVTLNNMLVKATNESKALTDRIVQVGRKLVDAEMALQEARQDLEDFEQNILLTYPPNTKEEVKSNKLTETYIRRMVQTKEEVAGQELYARLKQFVREAEKKERLLKAEKDACYTRLNHLKLVCENIRTHLSFVKVESQRGGVFG